MPFTIVVKDVSKMKVDAVVNSTNRHLECGGYGVDYSIHVAAGPELQEACYKVAPCGLTEVRVTPGFNLPCKIVIHTVGPNWRGDENSVALLRKTYENILQAAADNKCKSIAMPLISTGNRNFPMDIVLNCATEISKTFLEAHDMMIYLNVFSRGEFEPTDNFYELRESGRRRRKYAETVASFTDSPLLNSIAFLPDADAKHMKYSAQKKEKKEPKNIIESEHCMDSISAAESDTFIAADYCALPTTGALITPSIDFDNVKKVDFDVDESFGQLVTRLAEQYFEKTSQFYVAANITKSVYSKMKNNPEYIPSRSTALACAVVLKGKGVDEVALLKHAGMILSPNSKRDRVIAAAFEKNIYDVFKINEVLFCNDLPLLGYKT